MKVRRPTFGNFVLTACMILVAVACLYPLWYTIIISFSDKTAVDSGFVRILPVGFTLTSYERIVADAKFLNAFLVSVARVLLGGLINFLITVMMAFPISKSREEFKDKNRYLWFLIFVLLFPPTLIPLFLTVKALGMMNTIWALVLPMGAPVFNIIILANFFKTVPKEMDEAAFMDGLNHLQVIRTIIAPMCKPALAVVAIFTFLSSWNDFMGPFLYINDQSKFTLSLGMKYLISGYSVFGQWQILMAASVLIVLPVALLFFFMQRYFIRGLTMGGLKG